VDAKAPVKTLKPGDRARHYLAPWTLSAAAMPTALVLHQVWGGDAVMQDAVAAGAVLLTGAVHTTWSRRHEHTRLLATVYAGTVTGWVAVGTAENPVSHGMLNAWALGGLLLSALWNIRSASHTPAHETDKASGTVGGLDLSKVGGALTGAVAKVTKAGKGRVEADVQLKPGETAEGAEQERARIASLARVGVDQVTVTGNRGRADKVTLAFSDSPDQRAAVRGFAPGVLGRSVADAPLVIGQRVDGVDLAVWMVGNEDMDNPRVLGHTLCTGMTGAGKTETLNTLILRIRETRDMVPVVGDPAKFDQSFGVIADALEIAAKGRQQTLALVRNLPAVITYRSELLGTLERSDGTRGYSQWVPECWTLHGIPAVFVDIEEATDVLGTVDDEFDDAIRKARSVGVHLCASLQTAIHSNMERKTRGQFSNTLCHGCAEDYDAKFSLNSATLAAGADPTKWQNSYPGSLYGELVGVPPEQWSIDARAYGLTRAEKRALLNESRSTWAHLDPGTAMRLGRGIVMPDAKVTAGSPVITPDRAVGEQLIEAMNPEDQSVYTEEPQDEELDLTRVRIDGEDIDVTTPIPAPSRGGATIALGPPRTQDPDFEGAYRRIKLRLSELERGGEEHVTYKDISDIKIAFGVSRAWMYKALQRLEENGRLVSEVGAGKPPYRIVARVLNGTAVGQ
jgi:hypothetical protein